MEQKSFLFYPNWKIQLDLLNDDEKIRFVYNLIRYHQNEEVELISTNDKLVWAGVLPALIINKDKYEKKVAANRENGKQGGAPPGNQNASKSKSTQNNPNNPITDKREKKTGNSKKKKEKSEKETGNQEQEKEEKEQSMDVTGTSTSKYSGKYTGACLLGPEIDEINHIINTQYNDAAPMGKDSYFKYFIKSKLKEKILATGLLPTDFFEYFKTVQFDEVRRNLSPDEYASIEPMFLEYLELEYNFSPVASKKR